MKKLSLTATIYIVLSLLFVIGNFTAVMANPGRIEEPSFETVALWTYYATETDYVGAQATEPPDWVTQGTYSYKISLSNNNTGNGSYGQILQSSVDFSLIDRFSFDTYLGANASLEYEAQVWAGGTIVWSKAVPNVATEYPHESVDVSGITTTEDLIFRITDLVGAKKATIACYFDNIKIWGSYSDENTWLNVCNTFTGSANHIYMYGENFDAEDYIVRYWDAGAAQVGTDAGITVGVDGILTSSLACNTDTGATAGLWTAEVYFSEIFIAEDTFTVQSDAIPEFPTIFAAIGVAGLCFGIYFWMRKRRLAYVKA